jgi:hypothetical protein
MVGGFSPSEKYEFVSWDDYSQYMESHKIHVPSHQPENRVLTCDSHSHIPKIVKNPNSGGLNLDMSSQQKIVETYWCLVGNGLECGNGMIIDSYCGSFLHSLLLIVIVDHSFIPYF